jgi:glucosamine--fructose-6-phosphate aminotransferase (isomerizing)
MCGIVGYAGGRNALEILIRGLKRLEYRGYDSAGVAFFKDGKIEVRKSQGKIDNVERTLADLMPGKTSGAADIHVGIGHTRWATHGKPTTQNAHPHRTGHVVLVHNGIIENYQEIKKDLIARGHQPQSETDSELLGFLILEEMEKGASLRDGVRQAFVHVEGACSVVVMSDREPGILVGARNGSPLVAAADPQGGALLASDAQPLVDITREVVFLEQGDGVVGDAHGVHFFDIKTGATITRPTTHLDWSVETLSKQGFEHYMLKEIYEQPTALVDTFNGLLDLASRGSPEPFPLADRAVAELLSGADDIVLVACGSSWHAALLGKYWIERWAGVRVSVDLASEFRYRQPVLFPKSLVIAISQSGETADTLAVVRQVRGMGIKTLGISNVRGSTLSREADAVIYTSAGPEIGVAATKTFSAQMLALMIIAGYLGSHRKPKTLDSVFDQLLRVPHMLSGELGGGLIERARAVAKAVAPYKGFFFIGRGYSFPIALEGALKLKEIAYVNAEGYAGGELKHGPIAMIDANMVVVVLAPPDSWRDKTLSNLQEVKARGAVVLGVGDPSDESLKQVSDHWFPLPEGVRDLDECWSPFFLAPVIQLLSYELALIHGTDVDKPRNLAKSVTVE